MQPINFHYYPDNIKLARYNDHLQQFEDIGFITKDSIKLHAVEYTYDDLRDITSAARAFYQFDKLE